MKTFLLIPFLFLSILLHAQVHMKGTILDSDTKTALSFVNIGIKHKNTGTICSDIGEFSLLISETQINDTLTFSLVGYDELKISMKDIISSKKEIFELRPKPIQLPQVDIAAKKLQEEKHGIKKLKPKLFFVDASIHQHDIFEIAQVIPLSPQVSKLTSVNLLINQPSADTVTFRINFYDFDGRMPGKRLIELNITQKQIITSGWLTLDLKKYNIYLKGTVAVAIEFIPSKKNNPVYYEVKLGGTSRSFVRSSSLGGWHTPPHHYRIFVTTLEGNPEDKPDVDTEEDEMIPTTRFFSKHVQDTFSVFINLPKDYNKHKTRTYPTLFLLDANVYYDLVNASIKRLNQTQTLVEPIVIGIGYKDFITGDSLRNRDYTFPMALPEDSFPTSGGADKFLAFIQKELIPYLDKNFRTDTTNRTLMGHSLGGYFSLFALLKQEQENLRVFKNYVAASPSLEYGHQFLFSEFKNISLRCTNSHTRALLLTTGSLEDEEDGGLTFKAFENLLAEERFKNIGTTKLIYPKTDHMGTAMPTFDKGLEYIMIPK